MNDIHLSTDTFRGDWNEVLTFITGLVKKDTVRKIRLTKKKQSWEVEVNGEERRKTKSCHGAGLYDLYW